MKLTPGQRRILVEVASGDGYDVIANRLGLSEQTIKNTMVESRRRYGAQSTIELLKRIGWLTVPFYTVSSEGKIIDVDG